MKILALDHGSHRIGVALADSSIGVALARPALANDTKTLATLAELCQTEKIELVLVGHPKSLSGGASTQTHSAEEFAERLRQKLKLEVKLLDERFTSLLADQSLTDAGVKNRDQKQHRDSEAARLLLAEYLETL
jgi:putative Holliday junction resolvase